MPTSRRHRDNQRLSRRTCYRPPSPLRCALLRRARAACQRPRRNLLLTGPPHCPRWHRRMCPPRLHQAARRLQHLLRTHSRLRPHAGRPRPASSNPSPVAPAISVPVGSRPDGHTPSLLPARNSHRSLLLRRLAHVPCCLEQLSTRPARKRGPPVHAVARRPATPTTRLAVHGSRGRSMPQSHRHLLPSSSS